MFVVLVPRTYTSPREVLTTPLRALSRVDLPAPFGPTTAVIFPAGTAIETSSTIGAPPQAAVPATRGGWAARGGPGGVAARGAGGRGRGARQRPLLPAARPGRGLGRQPGQLDPVQDRLRDRPVRFFLTVDPPGPGQRPPERLAPELAAREQDGVHHGEVAPFARSLECPDQSKPVDGLRSLADQLPAVQPHAAPL